MKKRDLFAQLTEGFEALAEERAGKLTLRTHEVWSDWPQSKVTHRRSWQRHMDPGSSPGDV